MWILLLTLLLALKDGNSQQYREDFSSSTTRLPWNQYENNLQDTGVSYRNVGLNDNVIFKEA